MKKKSVNHWLLVAEDDRGFKAHYLTKPIVPNGPRNTIQLKGLLFYISRKDPAVRSFKKKLRRHSHRTFSSNRKKIWQHCSLITFDQRTEEVFSLRADRCFCERDPMMSKRSMDSVQSMQNAKTAGFSQWNKLQAKRLWHGKKSPAETVGNRWRWMTGPATWRYRVYITLLRIAHGWCLLTIEAIVWTPLSSIVPRPPSWWCRLKMPKSRSLVIKILRVFQFG